MPRERKVYKIPILGYVLHLIEAFFRLPRNDTRLRQLRSDIGGISGGNSDQQSRMNALEDRIRDLGNMPKKSEEEMLERLIPQFLNAVSTVHAQSYQLKEFERRLNDADADMQTLRADHGDQINQLWGNVAESGKRFGHLEGVSSMSQQGLAGHGDQIGQLWERIEFVRREIMFEMAHGSNGASGPAAREKTVSRIVDPEKVGAAQSAGALRLNLGCGHIPMEDYVNVDMRELPGVEVVAEVDDIPFEAGTVDEVYSAHLVEHFPQEAMRRRLLPYWKSLLKPGGRFRAITPDAAAMIDASGKGEYPYEDFREVLFGGQDYEGDYHYNLLTPDSMTELLREAGFVDIEVPVAGRRNGKCFEFEIVASKPGD